MSAALLASADAADTARIGVLLDRIGPALAALKPRKPGLVERFRFFDRSRFLLRDSPGAEAFITDYLRAESEEFSLRPDGVEARFVLQAPDRPAATLSCFVRLSATAPQSRPSAYGCSTLRLAGDSFMVDAHSPVFALSGKQRLAQL